MKPKPPKPPKGRILKEGGPIKPPRKYVEETNELDQYVPKKFVEKSRKKGRKKIKKMKE